MPNVEYIAGGATQNSIRVAQWMLQVPGATTYMGCVGDDEFAKKMTETATKDGVQVGQGMASHPAGALRPRRSGDPGSLQRQPGSQARSSNPPAAAAWQQQQRQRQQLQQ